MFLVELTPGITKGKYGVIIQFLFLPAKNQEVLHRLSGVYGHPGNVDVWVGGVMEEPVPGGRVGPTVRCLLVEQFRRIRDGDRFWYENPSTFSSAQLAQASMRSVRNTKG